MYQDPFNAQQIQNTNIYVILYPKHEEFPSS